MVEKNSPQKNNIVESLNSSENRRLWTCKKKFDYIESFLGVNCPSLKDEIPNSARLWKYVAMEYP